MNFQLEVAESQPKQLCIKFLYITHTFSDYITCHDSYHNIASRTLAKQKFTR